MARRAAVRTVVAQSKAPVIRIQTPAPIRARAKHHAKRAARAVGGVLGEGTLIPILAGAALGYAKKEGYNIPTLMGLGPAASTGIICLAAAKYGKVRWAGKAAVGLLSIAAYSWGKGEGIAGVGVTFDED